MFIGAFLADHTGRSMIGCWHHRYRCQYLNILWTSEQPKVRRME